MNSATALVIVLAAPLAGAVRAQDPASAQAAAQAGPNDSIFGLGKALELTLQGAVEIALQRNLGVQIEALAVDIARYDFRGSEGAFDWVVNARAGVTDSQFQPSNVFSETSQNAQEFSVDFTRPLTTGGTFRAHFDTVNTRTDSSFSVQPLSTSDVVTLSYTQPLLRGAWREYATAQEQTAELRLKRADEHERQVRHKLVSDVSLAYWDLVAARDQFDVAASAVQLAEEQVRQNERRLEAGLGTDVEVLQAQAEVARLEEARLLTDVRVRQSMDQLKQLLFPGTDAAKWDTGIVPSTALPEIANAAGAPEWQAALEIAVQRRPELRQQRFLIDEADVNHSQSRSERKPLLDLDLSASGQGFSGDSSEAFQTAAQFDYPSYRAALVFSYPLSNTTARAAERAAWARVRAAKLQYDELESTITGEIREAVRQVQYQAEAVRAARKSLELAQRQLAAEQARYQAQVSTNFQVLQFQQDLARAMSVERATRANFAKALVGLESAQGLLGDANAP